MALSKKNLVEVLPNIWIAKSDPDYHKKWLMYHPLDKEALFQYGKKLFEGGNVAEGIKHLEKASSLDYNAAKRFLNDINKPSIDNPSINKPSAVSFPSHVRIKIKEKTAAFIFPFLLSTFIYLMFIGIFFAAGFIIVHKVL